jgi:hypothetical protein
MGVLDYQLPANEPPCDDGGRYDGMADPLAGGPFTFLGRMPWKRSLDVAASPVGVGYETLDRDTFDPAATWDLMARSGAKWARVQTGWNKTETVAGVYDFAWLDRIVDGLIGIGMVPWLSLSYGNALHTPVPAYEEFMRSHPAGTWPHHIRGYVGEVPLYHGEGAVAAWQRYVRALARHYRGRVAHFEVWNEPNTDGCFWRFQGGRARPEVAFPERIHRLAADYVELVRLSREQVLAEIPGATIIAGAVSNGCNAPSYYVGMEQAGVSRQAEVISFHPYGLVPEHNLAARFNFIRHNLRTPRIWQGESGRVAGTPVADAGIIASEYNQAKFVVRRLVADVALGCEVSSYFNVSDLGGYYGTGDFDYGILDRLERRPKLAYHALRSVAYLFDGVVPAPDLYLHLRTMSFTGMQRHQLAVAQFRRKGVPLFALHFPEHPDVPFEPGQVDLQFYMPEDEAFTRPVVIDPIRRSVWRPDRFDRPEGGNGAWRIKPFPFTDYPLFLTDLAALEDADARPDDGADVPGAQP